MKTLYKYVSNPQFFLDDFYIRATQVTALNDPFEVRFSKSGLEKAESRYGEQLMCLFDNFEFERHLFGVVCLSETRDNLLMWSHYANEHKGCVLGFAISEQGSKSLIDGSFRFFENYKASKGFDGNIKNVTYRSSLKYEHDFLESELSEYCLFDESFKEEIYRVKSNDWMYEKEQRAVLPLEQADKIVVPLSLWCETQFSGYSISEFCTVNTEQRSIEVYMYKMPSGLRESIGEMLSWMSKDPRMIYLFKVSKLCLRSITFGYNCEPMELSLPVGYDFDSHNVRTEQAYLSKDSFSLDFHYQALD